MLVPPKCLQPEFKRLIELLQAANQLAGEAPQFGEWLDACYWIDENYLDVYFSLGLDTPVEWFIVRNSFLKNIQTLAGRLPDHLAWAAHSENWEQWLVHQPASVQADIQAAYAHDESGLPPQENPITTNARQWDQKRVTMEQARVARELAVKEAEKAKRETKKKGGKKDKPLTAKERKQQEAEEKRRLTGQTGF